MGDGFAPKPQPKPMMPSEPPNQTERYDLYGQYIDPYNEDIQLGKDGGKVEKYKSGGEIKKYKDGKVHKEDGYKKAARKASVYIADPKEKEPHGGVVKGGKSQKAKHRKMNLAETKAKNKNRVRKVEKWETGQGSKYKSGKSFKPKKKTRTYKRDEYGNIVKGK
jgi:hypothetical protein